MKSVFLPFLIAVLLIGCGGEATVEDPAPKAVSYDFVKAVLEEGIQTGEIGSAAMEVYDGLQVMADGGDTKAKELLAEFGEVEKSQGTGQFKKKAQSLLGKL